MEKETLFSLEVVVEDVCVLSSTVPCRLPAVAFRMLDFPTLVIHHIDEGTAEKIKTKLTLDPSVEVPPQLHELKDRFGIFNVNKGKSCLFKMDVKTLRAHLKNTPLYVMLIDMWPNVPKLVGNSTIPLDSSMGKICVDIDDNGINVPSVHGEKGRYKLYNLMSTEIGYVTLGYRLLSLGPGLIQHIPDHAISKAGHQMENVAPEVAKIQKAADIVIEDIETPKQKTAVVISNAREEVIKKPHAKPAMTQTEIKSKRAKQVKFFPEEGDDFHVSDTLCPPPLYFNSLAEDVVFAEKPSQPTAALTTSTPLWYEDEESDTASIASDISGIGYIESHYKFAQTQTTPFSIRKTTKKPTTPQKKLYPPASTPRQIVKTPPRQTTQPALLPQNLPLLNALLGELAQIQGMPLHVQAQEPVTPQRKPKTPMNVLRTPPPKGKENVKLPMRVSPKQPPKSEKKHRVCAQPAGRVPPNVGWLRQEPVYGKKKTKLSYGMTNTQRLRLQQNNPELLKQLEEEDAKHREMIYSTPDIDDSVDLGRFAVPERGPGFFGVTRTLGSEPSSSPRRRPVPTPRKSKGSQSPDVQQTTKPLQSKEPVARKRVPVERLNLNSLVSIAKEMESEQNGSSSTTRSGKSIEVRMPAMPTEHDTDISGDESEDEDKPTANIPGFPDERNQEKQDQSYDEDFEDSQASEYEKSQQTNSLEESHRSKSYYSDVSDNSYRSDSTQRSHRSHDEITSHHSPASQKSYKSDVSKGSQHSPTSNRSPPSNHSPASNRSPASNHSQQYYYSTSGSERSNGYSQSESYEDDSNTNSDLGIGGYYPSVLEEVAPKPSAESPMQATKTITVKGASAFEGIGSTPRTQTDSDKKDNQMYLSRESSEFKSVSVSSTGITDEAF